MKNFTSLLRRGLLAITLASTAIGAWAAPTSFHVNLNTATLGPDAKAIDFFFSRAGNFPQVTATVSNLTGAFGAVSDQGGMASVNADGSLTIGNGAVVGDLNYIDFDAIFGGNFGFDISFDTSFLGTASFDTSAFSLSVLDAMGGPVGGDFGLALFDLSSNGIARSGVGAFATITELGAPANVPEPSSVLMMMTGLGMVGFIARRRKPLATAAAIA
ncbi:MAG: putative exosortase interaction domain protein [Massilia sp.]|nr:putative exosortase interaction domain protein [Massilia sp.]